jgi:LuxR family maltose regulon positive regulatory protein
VPREQVREPPLLLTKLRPPAGREQTLRRDRLLERLRREPGVKLTIVAAPAGSGKTTLLGMWHDIEANRRPVAWVTLDRGDNDPIVLWSHVLEALRRVCPELDYPDVPELVGAPRIVDVVVRRLVNELSEYADVALILDDFHQLSSGPARDSVAWLIEHVPPTLQLVLASRSEPALPLGALRAHGELLELRVDDLGFTLTEADAFLNGRLALDLARGDVARLVARTEGWAAGLYLAALSLRGVRDRHAFVNTFGAKSRHLVDFLVDEVLEAHDPSMQTLMLHSSILDRFCARLCDAVLEEDGTGERLSALARTNLFLVPLDDRGEWYRFHHLFAQLLRVELEHREPGLAPTLHLRAHVWHREHGSIEEAVEHALEAGAFPQARDLIATNWLRATGSGRHATLLGWLERFPPEVTGGDPQLLLMRAWVLSLCGKREEAAEAVAGLEQLRWPDGVALPDGSVSLEASLATVRAAFPWDDATAAFENALRAAELQPLDSPLRAAVLWPLGMGCYNLGDLAGADRWFEEAVGVAADGERWLILSSALAYRSLIAGDRGHDDEQRELAERATHIAREHGVDDLRGEVHLALGVSRAARSGSDGALQLLAHGIEALRSAGSRLQLADGLIRQAAVLQTVHQDEAAAAAADEANAIVESCRDPGMLVQRLAALARGRVARRRIEPSPLSERELVVLRMLRGSLSEREIGRELYVSHNTIHSHTRSIYRKLGASSRAEAVRLARLLDLF